MTKQEEVLDFALHYHLNSREGAVLHGEVQSRLDRLAKLEEAIRFRSFDEPMNDNCEIELMNKNGEIESEYNTGGGVWNANRYTGWRYPVGDLSE